MKTHMVRMDPVEYQNDRMRADLQLNRLRRESDRRQRMKRFRLLLILLVGLLWLLVILVPGVADGVLVP